MSLETKIENLTESMNKLTIMLDVVANSVGSCNIVMKPIDQETIIIEDEIIEAPKKTRKSKKVKAVETDEDEAEEVEAPKKAKKKAKKVEKADDDFSDDEDDDEEVTEKQVKELAHVKIGEKKSNKKKIVARIEELTDGGSKVSDVEDEDLKDLYDFIAEL